MRTYAYSIALIVLGIYFPGCNPQNDTYREFISKSKSLVTTDPDSALTILGSIHFPEDLPDDLFYQYTLLEVQAKDRAYKNITDDTLIFKAKQYFIKKSDEENSLPALYYCARVLHERGEINNALTEYLEAGQYARTVEGEERLKALIHTNIGYIYYNEQILDKALEHYKESEHYFEKESDTKNIIFINSYIGNVFLLEEKSDSAMFYYNKSINTAKEYSLNSTLSDTYLNIGKIYQIKKEYKKANKYMSEALASQTDNLGQSKIFYNIGKLKIEENKIDSAILLLTHAEYLISDKSTYSLHALIYRDLSKIYQEKENYIDANAYTDLYIDAIKNTFDKDKSDAILDIQKRYDNEVLKNEQNQLRFQYFSILFMFIFIALIGIILFFKNRHRLKEKKRLKIENAHLEEEDKLESLERMAKDYNEMTKDYDKMAKDYNENTKVLHNIVLEHYSILKKFALIKRNLSNNEITGGSKVLKMQNEILYGQEELNWDKLYDAMNKAHNNFFGKLKKTFPELTDSEFKICCLIYADFSNEEVSIIKNLTANSISKKRTTIRKKLGINDYGDIQLFLKNHHFE